MFLIRTFQALEVWLGKSEAVTVLDQRFAFGNNILWIGARAEDTDPIVFMKAIGGIRPDLDGVLAEKVVGAEAKPGGPFLVPVRRKSGGFDLRILGVVKEIGFFADAKLVSGSAGKTGQAVKSGAVCGIKGEDCLKLGSSLRGAL